MGGERDLDLRFFTFLLYRNLALLWACAVPSRMLERLSSISGVGVLAFLFSRSCYTGVEILCLGNLVLGGSSCAISRGILVLEEDLYLMSV